MYRIHTHVNTNRHTNFIYYQRSICELALCLGSLIYVSQLERNFESIYFVLV